MVATSNRQRLPAHLQSVVNAKYLNRLWQGNGMADIRTSTGGVPSFWFEDFTIGAEFDLGNAVADRDEIIDFAKRYDPQWYHIDEDAARDSTWGELIASGWWTGSVMMRQYATNFLSKAAPDASPGMENLRWYKGIKAGDILTVSMKVTDLQPSSRGDHLGTAYLEWTAMVDGVRVASMTGRGWFHRRPTG